MDNSLEEISLAIKQLGGQLIFVTLICRPVRTGNYDAAEWVNSDDAAVDVGEVLLAATDAGSKGYLATGYSLESETLLFQQVQL